MQVECQVLVPVLTAMKYVTANVIWQTEDVALAMVAIYRYQSHLAGQEAMIICQFTPDQTMPLLPVV